MFIDNLQRVLAIEWNRNLKIVLKCWLKKHEIFSLKVFIESLRRVLAIEWNRNSKKAPKRRPKKAAKFRKKRVGGDWRVILRQNQYYILFLLVLDFLLFVVDRRCYFGDSCKKINSPLFINTFVSLLNKTIISMRRMCRFQQIIQQ